MFAALVPLVFALAQAPSAPAPEQKPAPSGPVVVLDTSLGTIRIVLNKEKAPLSVDNFLKYVRARHYDGTIFHRVMPGFMIQGGGFTPDMKEKATRPPIKNEATAPDSATSQFFINVRDNHRLDFGIGGAGYAVFGEVLEGMDVVDKIVAVPKTTKGEHENVPSTPILIKTAREGAPIPAAPSAPKPASMPAPSGSTP
jgi:cyclophilin family peptidyl-prolyl cis-trans isomerase